MVLAQLLGEPGASGLSQQSLSSDSGELPLESVGVLHCKVFTVQPQARYEEGDKAAQLKPLFLSEESKAIKLGLLSRLRERHNRFSKIDCILKGS